MPLEIGAKLGFYEVVSPIAANGGVELYKASDTRGNRTVALKVIPLDGRSDAAEVRARLEREAQIIASLNHPNICSPEIGREGNVDFIVSEYLEGESLAAKLEGGPLKLREALQVAADILDALDKAHRAGLIHRNLKPSNVMFTKTGTKLLDFGLSGLRGSDAPPPAVAPNVTVAPAAPAIPPALEYMAPEQFEEKTADVRTDMFSFGSIFYEMLTGKKAFEGKSRAVLIAAITTTDPDPLSKAAPYAPPALEHIIKRCLAKDPDDRWQTVHDLMVQFLWITQGSRLGLSLQQRKRERLILAALVATILVAGALAFPAARYFRAADAEDFQFRVPVRGLGAADIALSPDGQTIALVARPNQQEPAALFVRRTSGLAFQRLGGTDEATQPFWSPDSRYIAFVTGSHLKKVSVGGGAPQDISEVQGFTGGTWSTEGTILFGSAKGLFRVSAEGGKATAITTIDPQESGHFWPAFLPDAHHYLYLTWASQPANRGVFIGNLDSKEKTKLMAAESNAMYAAPGYVLFHRGASLFAQPFDAKKLALTGEPVHVADEVAESSASGRGDFDVSANGVLMYFQGVGISAGRGQTSNQAQFGWVTRTGGQMSAAGTTGQYGDFDLSPDGRLIALTQQDAGATADIWIVDWQRAAVSTRLTLNAGDNVDPVWSPDGTRVAFTSFRKGNADIYVKNANGVLAETALLESSADEIVKDWSKDGRYIAYLSGEAKAQDIYALPLTGDKKPFPVVQGPFQKSEPQFSYDGKWLAYTSNESGMFQVYVISFPQPDQRIQVSMAGGGQPRWKGDGKELYYRSLDNRIMAVDIKTSPRLESGAPYALFPSPRTNSVLTDPTRHQLAVTPDGARFLLMIPAGAAPGGGNTSGVPATPIVFAVPGQAGQTTGGITLSAIVNGLTVVQHWTAALGRTAK
jgi:eukaryotic-like serine/threonine-protein kinase